MRQKFAFLAQKKIYNQIPSIPGVFFTIPGDLEITPHFWRLPEIPGDLAGLYYGWVDSLVVINPQLIILNDYQIITAVEIVWISLLSTTSRGIRSDTYSFPWRSFTPWLWCCVVCTHVWRSHPFFGSPQWIFDLHRRKSHRKSTMWLQ